MNYSLKLARPKKYIINKVINSDPSSTEKLYNLIHTHIYDLRYIRNFMTHHQGQKKIMGQRVKREYIDYI